ncbi:hypothetical protein Dda_1244 [Drechslerella dactyloides]|uniref:Exonuclease domain-containing protein n=1 Tax=Drechslerella dactyloides TaxID=74499 RepID=A0AAD6NMW3_DREDA|nr:hypothetical protein Dda_1244 [Drechslerella dactyloides]
MCVYIYYDAKGVYSMEQLVWEFARTKADAKGPTSGAASQWPRIFLRAVDGGRVPAWRKVNLLDAASGGEEAHDTQSEISELRQTISRYIRVPATVVTSTALPLPARQLTSRSSHVPPLGPVQGRRMPQDRDLQPDQLPLLARGRGAVSRRFPAVPVKDSSKERSVTPPPPKRRRIDDSTSSAAPAKPPIKSILKKPSNGPPDEREPPSSNPTDSSFDSDQGQYVKLETTDHRTGLKTHTRIEKAGLGRILARPNATTPSPASTSTSLPSRGVRAVHTTTDKKTTTLAPKRDATTAALMTWGNTPTKPVAPEPLPESLLPRSVPRPPVLWEDRLKMLKALHQQYVRLDPGSQANPTAQQRLIKLVCDEEEAVALKESKQAYPVVIRLRLLALTKMKPDDYAKEIEAKRQAEAAEASKDADGIETGLTPEDEARAIAGYVHSFSMLKLYDYVVLPPSDAEVRKAKDGVVTASGEEECERCKSRFQVLPQKHAETGLWTTNGKCVHHHGKAWAVERGGPRVWQCCQQVVGETLGCIDLPTHVYNVKNPPRLAVLWQFVDTPAATTTTTTETIEKAVCLDCEMAYTTEGFEIIRLTATRFPTYETIIDVLVQPFGEVLDLNTRFSGVTPEQWDAAPFYKVGAQTASPAEKPTDKPTDLQKVLNPMYARDLLFEYIDASTILIGHSLENDLKCMRIIHPRVVDTAILYPRRNMPARYSLKWLVKNHLGRYIQATDTGKGHDSKEDANEAGNLVRKKLMSDVRSGKVGMDGIWAVAEALDTPLKTENQAPPPAA